MDRERRGLKCVFRRALVLEHQLLVSLHSEVAEEHSARNDWVWQYPGIRCCDAGENRASFETNLPRLAFGGR